MLQAVDAQHGGQRIGSATVAWLGINRSNDRFELSPRHDLIHLGQKDFAASALLLGGEFEISEGHLLSHGGILDLANEMSVYGKVGDLFRPFLGFP